MSISQSLRAPAAAVTLTAALSLSACIPGSVPDDDASSEPAPSASSQSQGTSAAAPAAPFEEPELTDEGLINARHLSGEPIEVIEGEHSTDDGSLLQIPEHDEPLVVVFEVLDRSSPIDHLKGMPFNGGPYTPEVSPERPEIFLLDPYGSDGWTEQWSLSGTENSYRISFYPLDSLPVVTDDDSVGASGPGLYRLELEDDAYLKADRGDTEYFEIETEPTSADDGSTRMADIFHWFDFTQPEHVSFEIAADEYLMDVGASGPWSIESLSEDEFDSDGEASDVRIQWGEEPTSPGRH